MGKLVVSYWWSAVYSTEPGPTVCTGFLCECVTTVPPCPPSTRSIFIYLRFYVTFNTVQVTSRWVVGRAEETSTYNSSRFCTVNCRPTASNYQLSHLRPCREPNPGLRGGRRECYRSATVAPNQEYKWV